MRLIEEEHLELNNLAKQQKAILDKKKRLLHDRARLSPWVGENSVQRATGAVTRHKVMTELVNSIIHIHGFIELNKQWFKNADEKLNDIDQSAEHIMCRFRNDRAKLESKQIARQFSKEILSAAGSELFAERLRRDYFAHLDATHARLIELPKVHREMLLQSGVRKLMHEWSSEVKKHHDIIIAQWKAINMQNADEFNATVWRERFLDELKAKNALNVESPDGGSAKCQCLLGGARVSIECNINV
uniref:CHAD domain-containing protein n=1 Tax=Globodera pallida TaxID=36090 RepID=A0A183BLA9_GLOPA